jgi:hypothetical protein
MRSTLTLSLILTLCGVAIACGDSGESSDSGGTGSANSNTKREVPCTDESVSELTLFDEPNPAKVFNDPLEEGFQTEVDATAGGMSPSESFIYLKFNDDGLKPVELSDEAAFDSLDWDLAIRRYIIRLNSGVSGPGIVKAARTKPGSTFDNVDKVPDGLEFRVEEYFTDSCVLVNDTSGLGAPGTALASFWSYKPCVKMTHNIYIIEIARPKTRHIKLEVMGYYPPDRQKICDATDMVPSPSGGGDVRIRWAFLD